MKTITKSVTTKKANQLNIYSGYSYINGLNREILCMKLLYKAYIKYGCTCGRDLPHFPTLVKYISNNNSGYITMTHQGEDVQKLRKKRVQILIEDDSIYKQIDCILNILDKVNITHLDLNDNGKNICINESGHISIIDFDIMYMKYFDNQNTLTPLMYKRINKFSKTDFKEKIYNIIKTTGRVTIY
jgi:hypothetical protein